MGYQLIHYPTRVPHSQPLPKQKQTRSQPLRRPCCRGRVGLAVAADHRPWCPLAWFPTLWWWEVSRSAAFARNELLVIVVSVVTAVLPLTGLTTRPTRDPHTPCTVRYGVGGVWRSD